MIRCEFNPPMTEIEIHGPMADVNFEFMCILKHWADQMAQVSNAPAPVHIWNTLIVALGEDMEECDVMEAAAATDAGRFYVPKRGDGLPLTLWALLEGGVPYDRRTADQ